MPAIEEICKDYSAYGFHCETVSTRDGVPHGMMNISIDVDYINTNICSKVTGDVTFRFLPSHINWYPVGKHDIAGNSAYELTIKSTGKKYVAYGCALRSKVFRSKDNLAANFSDGFNYNDNFIQVINSVIDGVNEYFRKFEEGLMDKLKDATSPVCLRMGVAPLEVI